MAVTFASRVVVPHHMPMFSSDDGAASEASVDARASAAPAAPRKVFDTPSEAESQAAISGQRRRRRAASKGRLARAKRAEAQEQRRSIRAIVFDYILQGSMVSTRALSALWQHPACRKKRLPIRAAILIMERQSVRLLALLRTIREWQSSLQPVLFAESRMYDETPWRSRVGDMGKDGEMDVDDVAAKIMACTLQFAMVLRPVARAKQEADAACCSQEGCVVVPRPGAAGNVEVGSPGAPQQDVIIQGQLFTLLVPMADQEAHTVLTAIRQKMQLPATVAGEVASIFPRRAVLRCSDLHRSNLAAERQEDRAEGERRPSALFRCAMHRSRTAEQRTLELDAATESFCFNLGRLWRATPGAMASFRKRVRKWVKDKLHIIPGPPPARVTAWRMAIRDALFPHLAHGRAPTYSEAARLFLWETLLTGDGRRRDRVEHYEIGCCRDKAQTRARFMGPHGLKACLTSLPRFSRKSWQGQEDDVSKILFLELNHGMISNNWAMERCHAELQARRVLREHAQNAAAAAAAAAAAEAAAVADTAAAGAVAAAFATDAGPSPQDDVAAAKSIHEYMQAPHFRDRLIRFALCTQPFSGMKAQILARSEAPWKHRRIVSCAGEGRRADRPVAMGYESESAAQCLRSLSGKMHDDATWACMLRSERDPMGYVDWVMLSRGGAITTEIVLREQRRYPWKLFAMLRDPALAEDVLEDHEVCPHILDAFSRAHVAKYPSPSALRSSESLHELHAQAAIAAEHTGRRERGHATFKRRVRASNACGWQEALQMTSAQNVLTCWRAECSSWYGSTQPGNSNAEGGSAPPPPGGRAPGGGVGGDNAPHTGGRAPAGNEGRRRQKNKRRGRDRKKRDDKNNKGGSCRAWFAVNHVGKYTREAHARCRVAMQDPAVRAEYESIGAQMARGAGGAKRRDVARDGNCMFHALLAELTAAHLQRPCLPVALLVLLHPLPTHGLAWSHGHVLRQWYLEYVGSTQDEIAGQRVQSWITTTTGLHVGQYVQTMRERVDGAIPRRAWGGFMEISLICRACRGGDLACVVLQSLDGGRHRILAVVGEMTPDARVICVAWSGSHWQRARVTQVGRRQVQAWWHAR